MVMQVVEGMSSEEKNAMQVCRTCIILEELIDYAIISSSLCSEQIVTNDDLAKIMDTSDEWISSRTGIKRTFIWTRPTVIWLQGCW